MYLSYAYWAAHTFFSDIQTKNEVLIPPYSRVTLSVRGRVLCNSYRMSARGAWIGTTSARGNVNSKRRQPRGVYIPRAEVIPIHAPRARIR